MISLIPGSVKEETTASRDDAVGCVCSLRSVRTHAAVGRRAHRAQPARLAAAACRREAALLLYSHTHTHTQTRARTLNHARAHTQKHARAHTQTHTRARALTHTELGGARDPTLLLSNLRYLVEVSGTGIIPDQT